MGRGFRLLVAESALLGFAGSLLYAVANALFLDRFGSHLLPYVYLATAVGVSGAFALLMRLQRRRPLSHFVIITIGSLAAIVLTARLLLDARGFAWIPFALMVVVILVMQSSMIVLGCQAGRLWDLQELKKRYPLVMAAQIAGVIVGGGAVGPLGRMIGAPNLLFVCAAVLAAAAVIVTATPAPGRSADNRSDSLRRDSTSRAPVLFALGGYVLLLVAFRVVVELASNLVNYLFLQQVESRFRSLEGVTGFLGPFMAAATLLTLVFLVAASSRLLMRFGVGFGLAANAFAVGSLLALGAAGALSAGDTSALFFLAVVGSRLVNFVFVTGLTDPALKTTYQPLPPASRNSVQTTVEGLGVPAATGVAGAFLLFIRSVPGIGLIHIILLTIAIMGTVVILAAAAGRSYRNAIERILRGPTIDPDRLELEDSSGLDAVRALLTMPDRSRVLLALDLLAAAGHEASPDDLTALLDRDDQELVVKVLEHIEANRRNDMLPSVRRLLSSDRSAAVRSAALRTVTKIDSDGEVDASRFVEDPDREVRLEAMAGLLRSRGIDGAVAIAPELDRLRRSSTRSDRLELAALVDRTGRDDFISPLYELLEDSDREIRRAAIRAAATVATPRLAGVILRSLDDVATRADATEALVALGTGLPPVAAGVLADPKQFSNETRRRLIRACGRVGGVATIRLLSDALAGDESDPGPDLRLEIAKALAAGGYQVTPEERPRIRRLLFDELDCSERLRAALRVLSGSPDSADHQSRRALVSALDDEIASSRRLVCRLCAFLYEAPGIVRAEALMQSGSSAERSIARELLEVGLPKAVRSPVLALFESIDAGARSVRSPIPGPAAAEETIHDIVTDPWWRPYEWLRACALRAVTTKNQDVAAVDGDRGRYSMIDIERVMLLKSSPIFAETPDRALASLAGLMERVDAAGGVGIIRKGDLESCLFVIADGKVRVHDGSRDIAVLGKGEIIGEMALLDPAPRSASVTAEEDSVLLRLEKEVFDLVMADNPEIVHGVIQVLCRRLRDQIERSA